MLHTLLVVGAGLILALLGSVLLAPLSNDLVPTVDAAERRGPRACTKPD